MYRSDKLIECNTAKETKSSQNLSIVRVASHLFPPATALLACRRGVSPRVYMPANATTRDNYNACSISGNNFHALNVSSDSSLTNGRPQCPSVFMTPTRRDVDHYTVVFEFGVKWIQVLTHCADELVAAIARSRNMKDPFDQELRLEAFPLGSRPSLKQLLVAYRHPKRL